MKKLLSILIISLTVGFAGFADSFIAFTDQQSIEDYNNKDTTAFDAAVKAEFANCTAEYSKQEKKNFTHIIVVDESNILYKVWVYHVKGSKTYGIAIVDADGNPVGDYHYETDANTDPVQVGLNFIKEISLQIFNVNTGKVVASSFEVE